MTPPDKVCPIHGVHIDAIFCTVCGQRLINEPTCACGKTVSIFDYYCGACGTALQRRKVGERFRNTIRELMRRMRQALH
jgi:hypothetical protein